MSNFVFIVQFFLFLNIIVYFLGASLEDTTDEISCVEMIQFDLDSIKAATNNFASENKLGQGGFGVVYKV